MLDVIVLYFSVVSVEFFVEGGGVHESEADDEDAEETDVASDLHHAESERAGIPMHCRPHVELVSLLDLHLESVVPVGVVKGVVELILVVEVTLVGGVSSEYIRRSHDVDWLGDVYHGHSQGVGLIFLSCSEYLVVSIQEVVIDEEAELKRGIEGASQIVSALKVQIHVVSVFEKDQSVVLFVTEPDCEHVGNRCIRCEVAVHVQTVELISLEQVASHILLCAEVDVGSHDGE